MYAILADGEEELLDRAQELNRLLTVTSLPRLRQLIQQTSGSSSTSLWNIKFLQKAIHELEHLIGRIRGNSQLK